MKMSKKVSIQDIEEYPNKSIFYSFDKAKEVYQSLKSNKILLPDAMLLLFYAQPDNCINGRISLMKQMFLVTHEIFRPEEVQDAKFIPYHYGWFSFEVMNDLENLIFLGYIIKKGKTNTSLEQFQISPAGKQYITHLFLSLPVFIQNDLREKRKGWDQLGCEGMLKYMYSKYPESIERSKLKERYKPITWGRAKA
jgi:hypothetical protein